MHTRLLLPQCLLGLPQRLLGLVQCGLVLVAFGCGESGVAPTALPNIVLITLDTTRADHLGTYGYFRDTSPNFDAFASEAITFDALIVPVATTLPSHLSILTSSHPLEHGVLANTTQGGERFIPAPDLVSFTMEARELGYATGAFVSASPLKRGSGIEVGFDTFDQPVDTQRNGRDTARAAIEWLSSVASDRPFFLWVHFYDAHFPFEPPTDLRNRFQLDDALEAFIQERQIHDTAPRSLVGTVDTARSTLNLYDAELVYQDIQLERVLDAVRTRAGGGWARTAVVITGDHGEGLCQHGEAAHGSTWQEQLRAPLAIRIPGEAPQRVETLLTSADILPTLLARLAVPQFESFLARALGNDVLAADFVDEPVLSHDTGRERDEPFKYALNADGFKYFRVEREGELVEERLFDIGADPHELRDVSATHVEVLAAMRKRTRELIDERRARGKRLRAGVATVSDGSLDPQLLRELCALGYLPPERCSEAGSVPAPSPSEGGS